MATGAIKLQTFTFNFIHHPIVIVLLDWKCAGIGGENLADQFIFGHTKTSRVDRDDREICEGCAGAGKEAGTEIH